MSVCAQDKTLNEDELMNECIHDSNRISSFKDNMAASNIKPKVLQSSVCFSKVVEKDF